MHGMKAPSGPEMHQLCSGSVHKVGENHEAQVCNSETRIVSEQFCSSVTG